MHSESRTRSTTIHYRNMKCVALLFILSCVVAVKSYPDPAVHRVTGELVTRTHKISGRKIEREGEGGGEGGEIIEGGGDGGGGKRVHRVKHRIPGKKIEKKVRRVSGGGEGGPPRGDGGPKLPEGPKLSGGPGGPNLPKGNKLKGKNGNTNCRNSGLTKLADYLNIGLQDLVDMLGTGLGANDIKPGLLGHVAGGLETLLKNTLGGLDQGVSDFFCGFNRVFNKIGSKAAEGKLLGGVLSGALTFLTGAGSFFGNLGENAIGAVTSGVSDLVKGRRSKKLVHNEVVHRGHGDSIEGVH